VLFTYHLLASYTSLVNSVGRQTAKVVNLAFCLLALSGIPPFPMFFIKIYLLTFSLRLPVLNSLILLLLIGAAIMLVAYIRFCFKYIL